MDEAVKKLLPAIEEQLNSPETPYVREAFDRILTEPDIEEEEAKAMLAFCLADDVRCDLLFGLGGLAGRWRDVASSRACDKCARGPSSNCAPCFRGRCASRRRFHPRQL